MSSTLPESRDAENVSDPTDQARGLPARRCLACWIELDEQALRQYIDVAAIFEACETAGSCVDALMTVREVLRAAGFTEELGYKRDVDTNGRIYGPDKWYVRA